MAIYKDTNANYFDVQLLDDGNGAATVNQRNMSNDYFGLTLPTSEVQGNIDSGAWVSAPEITDLGAAKWINGQLQNA